MDTIRTLEKRTEFLTALSSTGNVSEACRLTGVARNSMYLWKQSDLGFAPVCRRAQKEQLPKELSQLNLHTIKDYSGGDDQKTVNEPHAKRRGWLRNGNPQGDPARAPRCGARTRRGSPCGCRAIRGKKRCRIHGRLSTEPRTPAGLARSKLARWKHGLFSAEARQETAHFRQLLRECKEMENVIELDEQLSMPFQVWSTSILAASVTTRLSNSRPNC